MRLILAFLFFPASTFAAPAPHKVVAPRTAATQSIEAKPVQTSGLPPDVVRRYTLRVRPRAVSCAEDGTVSAIASLEAAKAPTPATPAAQTPAPELLWKLGAEVLPHPAQRHLQEGGATDLQFLPGTKYLRASAQGNVFLVDLETGERVPDLVKDFPRDKGDIDAVTATSNRGRFVALSRTNGVDPAGVFLRDMQEGKIVKIPGEWTAPSWISDDGKFLLVTEAGEPSPWAIVGLDGKVVFPKDKNTKLAAGFVILGPDAKTITVSVTDLKGTRTLVLDRATMTPVNRNTNETPFFASADRRSDLLGVGALPDDSAGPAKGSDAVPVLYNPATYESLGPPPTEVARGKITPCRGYSPYCLYEVPRTDANDGFVYELRRIDELVAGGPVNYVSSELPRLIETVTRQDPRAAWIALNKLRLGGHRRGDVQKLVDKVALRPMTENENKLLKELEERLASGSFPTRRRTMEDMKRLIGVATEEQYRTRILPALQAAASSGDKEVQWRAAELLKAPRGAAARAADTLISARLGLLAP